MKKELRFSPKAEAALRQLAGLPWTGSETAGLVRCEGVCPVCAAAISEAGVFGWEESWTSAVQEAGWSQMEWRPVARAADLANDTRRPRLLELLGVSR